MQSDVAMTVAVSTACDMPPLSSSASQNPDVFNVHNTVDVKVRFTSVVLVGMKLAVALMHREQIYLGRWVSDKLSCGWVWGRRVGDRPEAWDRGDDAAFGVRVEMTRDGV